MDTATFHAGEQALQARSGLRERLAAIGPQIVRDHMPDQHRTFFAGLPSLLLGVQDDTGQPWATLLHGAPGFILSPDSRTLEVHARPAVDDAVAPWLVQGTSVGLLGLEPHTRRRNRANGRVRTSGAEGFTVDVLQSFGNCPKYIHGRRPEPVASRRAGAALSLDAGLDAASIGLLRSADTLFIASASGAHPGAAQAEGVDVSHRGGPAGFVGVDIGARGVRLTLPDYSGNFYFNTLGNLTVWPLAGVLVPDFEDGTLLQLAAEASIEFDGPRLASFPGAQRLLNLTVLSGRRRPAALPWRWSAPQAPPQFVA